MAREEEPRVEPVVGWSYDGTPITGVEVTDKGRVVVYGNDSQQIPVPNLTVQRRRPWGLRTKKWGLDGQLIITNTETSQNNPPAKIPTSMEPSASFPQGATRALVRMFDSSLSSRLTRSPLPIAEPRPAAPMQVDSAKPPQLTARRLAPAA